MIKIVKVIALASLLVPVAYGASTAACVGCHGTNFEKKALGKSKVVSEMNKADIVAAMKGYKDGSYGGATKGMMKGPVAALSDADIDSIADKILGTGTADAAPAAKVEAPAATPAVKGVVDINKAYNSAENFSKDDLANKKEITEKVFGLRKTDLYSEEDTVGEEAKYSKAAPGTSQRIERAFQDAPPMIPHDVEGMLPIKTGNNQCVSCHMPEAAKASGAVPLPKSHFTDFRPKHNYDGKMFTQAVDSHKNEVAIKELDKLSMSRFNCTQCHAPQSTAKLIVSSTFEGGFTSEDGKSGSSWSDNMTDDLATLGENSVVTEADKANANSAAGSLDEKH